jgi:hypothetical protein
MILAIFETALVLYNLTTAVIEIDESAIFSLKILVDKCTCINRSFRGSLSRHNKSLFENSFDSWLIIETLSPLAMEKAILEVSIIHEVTCSQDPIAVFKIVDEVALVGRSLSLVFAKTFQHTI